MARGLIQTTSSGLFRTPELNTGQTVGHFGLSQGIGSPAHDASVCAHATRVYTSHRHSAGVPKEMPEDRSIAPPLVWNSRFPLMVVLVSTPTSDLMALDELDDSLEGSAVSAFKEEALRRAAEAELDELD